MKAPAWCSQAPKEIQEFVNYPNHPCQFLTNATAAAIAGGIS